MKPKKETIELIAKGDCASGNGCSLAEATQIVKKAEICPCCDHKAYVEYNNGECYACEICDHFCE